MHRVDFEAQEYQADGGFRPTAYRFQGTPEGGWTIARAGRERLRLGPGYRLLRTRSCGVCSTDLARRFLPFPLPQITGHEVVAEDESGAPHAVEINASHLARGLEVACPFCRDGLANHCPARLVLGIHDLPGGFGPWVLAPVRAALPIPAAIPAESAVFVEPFAAALNAVTTVAPALGERVAVLGPRRLGMLVIAALSAWTRARRLDLRIVALLRHAELAPLAEELGATEVILAAPDGTFPEAARSHVVIDTTGNPEALATAVALARREVHLKSTHGRPAQGLRHTTEFVVDELDLRLWPDEGEEDGAREWISRAGRAGGSSRPRVAWLARVPPPHWLERESELALGPGEDALAAFERSAGDAVPRADHVVAGDAAAVDDAVRPRQGSEIALVRPRGTIWIHPAAKSGTSRLLAAIAERGLRLSSSRCGDFRAALELMAADARLRRLGERLVTHRFAGDALPRAFETARSSACIKAVVEHRGGG
jgi:threonine dehydrogenase-like Zn-dependent dehydrogenase